jgi:hypothetical protein
MGKLSIIFVLSTLFCYADKVVLLYFSPLASSAQAVLTVLFAKAMQVRFSPMRFISAISHCSLLLLGLSGKALMTSLASMDKSANGR